MSSAWDWRRMLSGDDPEVNPPRKARWTIEDRIADANSERCEWDAVLGQYIGPGDRWWDLRMIYGAEFVRQHCTHPDIVAMCCGEPTAEGIR